MRRENHTMMNVIIKIFCFDQPDSDSNRRNFGKSQEEAIFHGSNTTVFDSECFQVATSEKRRERRIFMKMNSVFTTYKPKIRESRQIILSLITDYSRVRSIKRRIILIE